MSLDRRRIALPLLAALALAALAIVVSACGYTSHSKAVSEGEAVKMGELQYEVIFSRYLNPNDNEDSAYLVGQPTPPNGSTYFGIFLQVQNESNESQELPSTLWVTDATHRRYDLIASESLYAFPFGGEVESEGQSGKARPDLGPAVIADPQDFAGSPVREPEVTVVPARRFDQTAPTE